VRLYVEGEELPVESAPAEVTRLADRLLVRTPEGAFSAVAVRQGDAVLVSYKGAQYRLERTVPRAKAGGAAASGEIRAPMPGAIVDVLVEEGQEVTKGQRLLVLEAMKTQQPFTAPFDGVVRRLPVGKGDQVVDGALLALVEPRGE
jgi:biotin carboxyl carrier protein